MPGAINSVKVQSIPMDDWHFTFILHASITAADVGKAVALDTTAEATVKLAGDNEAIFGRLETFEDRVVEGIKVGTVATKGIMRVPYTGSVVVGTVLVGSATAGSVKPAADAAAAGAQPQARIALDIDATNGVVHALFA